MSIILRSEADDILVWEYHPNWTWTDFEKTLDEERRLMSTSREIPYYVIGDFTLTSHVPKGNSIGNVKRSLEVGEKNNRKLTIVISKSMYIRMLINMLTKIAPMFKDKFFAVDSMSDAIEYIDGLRSKV